MSTSECKECGLRQESAVHMPPESCGCSHPEDHHKFVYVGPICPNCGEPWIGTPLRTTVAYRSTGIAHSYPSDIRKCRTCDTLWMVPMIGRKVVDYAS